MATAQINSQMGTSTLENINMELQKAKEFINGKMDHNSLVSSKMVKSMVQGYGRNQTIMITNTRAST